MISLMGSMGSWTCLTMEQNAVCFPPVMGKEIFRVLRADSDFWPIFNSSCDAGGGAGKITNTCIRQTIELGTNACAGVGIGGHHDAP